MVSDLGGSQVSTLLETLPGIANVLRSPVANAITNLTRAAARLDEFNLSDADELVRYAIRRSLLGNDEGEQLLAEVRAAQQKRLDRAADRAADRAKTQQQKPRAKSRPKAVKTVRPVKAAKIPNKKKAPKGLKKR